MYLIKRNIGIAFDSFDALLFSN